MRSVLLLGISLSVLACSDSDTGPNNTGGSTSASTTASVTASASVTATSSTTTTGGSTSNAPCVESVTKLVACGLDFAVLNDLLGGLGGLTGSTGSGTGGSDSPLGDLAGLGVLEGLLEGLIPEGEGGGLGAGGNGLGSIGGLEGLEDLVCPEPAQCVANCILNTTCTDVLATLDPSQAANAYTSCVEKCPTLDGLGGLGAGGGGLGGLVSSSTGGN